MLVPNNRGNWSILPVRSLTYFQSTTVFSVKIYENRNKRRVGINGMKIGGCILKQICSVCRKNLVYYDKFDADFCPSCNVWKQEKMLRHELSSLFY